MCLFRSPVLLAISVLVSVSPPVRTARADLFAWLGQSGDFSDPALWNPFGTPGPEDIAIVPLLFTEATITSNGNNAVADLRIHGRDSLLRFTSSVDSSVLAAERVYILFNGEIVVEGLSIAVEAFPPSTNVPTLHVSRTDMSFDGTLARLNAPSANVTLGDYGYLRFLNGSTADVGALSAYFQSMIEVKGDGSLLNASELSAHGVITIENGAAIHVAGGKAEFINASVTAAGNNTSFTVDGDLALDQSSTFSSSHFDVHDGGAIVIGGDLRMSDNSSITIRGVDSQIQARGRIVSLGTIEVLDGANVRLDQIGVADAVIPGEVIDRTAKFNVSGTNSRLEIGEVVLPQGLPWGSEIEITGGASLQAPLVQAADFQNLNRTVLRVSGPFSQLIAEETLRIGLPPHGALGPFGGVGEIVGGAQVQAASAEVVRGTLRIADRGTRIDVTDGDLRITGGRFEITGGSQASVASGGAFIVEDLNSLTDSNVYVAIAGGAELTTHGALLTSGATAAWSGAFVVQDEGSVWRDVGTSLIDGGGFIVRNGGLAELNDVYATGGRVLVQLNGLNQATTLRIVGDEVTFTEEASLIVKEGGRIEVPNAPRVDFHSDRDGTSLVVSHRSTFISPNSELYFCGMGRPTLFVEGNLVADRIVFSDEERDWGNLNSTGSIRTRIIDLGFSGNDTLSNGGHIQVDERLTLGKDDILGNYFGLGFTGTINIGAEADMSGHRKLVRVGPSGVLESNSWWLASSVWVDGGTFELGEHFTSVDVGGDFRQSSDGLFRMSISGVQPGIDFSQIQLVGDLNFAGTIEVSFIDSFAPKEGDFFDLIVQQAGLNEFSVHDPTVMIEGLAPGWQYDLQAVNGRLRLLSLSDAVAIPETPAFALSLAGIVMLLLDAIRRRSRVVR